MRDYAGLLRSLKEDLSWCGEIDQGFTTSDQLLKSVAASSLANSFFKKLAPRGKSDIADTRALAKFISRNTKIGASGPPQGMSEIRHLQLEYWKQNYREVMDFEQEDYLESLSGRVVRTNFDLDFIRSHFKSGPGASVLGNAKNFYTKLFDSPLSSTCAYLIAIFRAAVSESDSWAVAELQRFRKFGFELVEGNTLFFAPKNAEISRPCCTEPALNMLIQQAIGTFLELRLKKWFKINLSTQPDVNRWLACLGSIDGSFGTLDLTEASDCTAWSLIEKNTPPNILGWLRLSRSPRCTLPSGDVVDLHMISTMGNGFTFPLETIVFACAVKSIYQLKGINLFTDFGEPNFSVFGDDIIVRREAYDAVVTLLEDLGYVVNVSKSFNDGPFRESCGFDYYRGNEVRGVYIETLESTSDVYSAINRLTRWSAKHDISLSNTLSTLKTWVRFQPIPFSEADDAGIKVSYKSLQKYKFDEKGWTRYRYLAPRPTVTNIPRDATESRQLGYKDFNPSGWAVCFLGGYAHNPRVDGTPRRDPPTQVEVPRSIASDLIGFRPKIGVPTRYRVKSDSIPYWDAYGPKDPRFPARNLARWLTSN